MKNEIIDALLGDEDEDDAGLSREMAYSSDEVLDQQLSELLPQVIAHKEADLGKRFVRTIRHTNPKGETFIFGRFGRRNHVLSTLLFLDPDKGWVSADPGFTYVGMLRHTIREDIRDDDEEGLRDVHDLEPKPYLPLGSVSHGTMRSEDLIPQFLYVLKSVDPGRARELENEYEDEPHDAEGMDYFLERLYNALDHYAPPYTYFGSHPGNGSDFGVWVSDEAIDDALKYEEGEIATMRPGEPIPVGSHYVLVVDDAGNYRELLNGANGVAIWKL